MRTVKIIEQNQQFDPSLMWNPVSRKAFYNSEGEEVDISTEQRLRDFLYSPEGIATTIGVDAIGGEPLVMILFGILLIYDVSDWIEKGEPNWLYFICDLLCTLTAGFASSALQPLIKVGLAKTFKSIDSVFEWIFKNFRTVFNKFVIPLKNSITNLVSKIVRLMKNLKDYKLPKFIIDKFSQIQQKLSLSTKTITTSINNILGKTGGKIVFGYAKYKTLSEILGKIENTDWVRNILIKCLPYINPLLGSDKIDPFIVELISKNDIDLSKYKIHPKFLDNSQDTF